MSTSAVPPIPTIDSNPAIDTDILKLFDGEQGVETAFDGLESEVFGSDANPVLK